MAQTLWHGIDEETLELAEIASVENDWPKLRKYVEQRSNRQQSRHANMGAKIPTQRPLNNLDTSTGQEDEWKQGTAEILQTMAEGGDVNECWDQLMTMVKGKGKGKGGNKGYNQFPGHCGHCGEYGHRKSQCAEFDKVMEQWRAEQGKGKAKGKGQNKGGYESKGGGKGFGQQKGGYKGQGGWYKGGGGKGNQWGNSWGSNTWSGNTWGAPYGKNSGGKGGIYGFDPCGPKNGGMVQSDWNGGEVFNIDTPVQYQQAEGQGYDCAFLLEDDFEPVGRKGKNTTIINDNNRTDNNLFENTF